MYRIFIIEDDASLSEVLKKQIAAWGYEVCLARNFRDVLPDFVDFDPHLAIIDISLPFYNGFHWCREIRKISQVPVVFLSSSADNMNIVMALNMGADDFISKPVDLSVLTAKLQAILRRTYDLAGRVPVLEHRGAVLNMNDFSLTYQGNRLELSRNEYRILQTLMENRGKYVSRDSLMNALWQDDCYIEDNTLTVNVARLRKKLESLQLANYIVTKPGSGYIIE